MVKEVSFVHSRSAEAASDEDNRHLQRLRANDLSYKDLPQGPAKLHQVTSFHSSGLPSPVPSTSISSSSPQHPAHAPFMLMVTSPHVPHGHALATAAKDTRFSCHQVQSSSVQSKGHVHTNCMSCEPLRMLPQDAQESGSRSCLQERGTPPCPHHSRENEVEMFNSLAKSFQSSTSQSSLESDSSPPTVSNFVPSLSSSPHSSLFYATSTSDTSRSVYSSSSGVQLSASRSFMSGSTAVESSSTPLRLPPPS
ncbi:uncharacterized protein LOC127006423 [Eriocheir sinensis]|uniref:uncharacterized protein LOC127006423 n=1 Tax=Eriocheir sinensis TaxID=95602 RepID=UPI0021C5D549|nr:uncharacterized protein LOC127006423 [Eriocheir sinensis]